MSNSEKAEENPQDQRERQRHCVHSSVKVNNLRTGETLGRLVNAHSDGLMIMGSGRIEEDCIYQLRILLSEPIDGHQQFDIGADCVWVRSEASEALKWAGFRIIDLSEEAARLLNALVEEP